MKSYMNRHEALGATLRELEQYSTLSPFCRLFYKLLVEMLYENPESKLEQALHVFLRCELRRHAAASRIVRNGRLELLTIISAGRKAHDRLEHLRQTIEPMELPNRQHAIIRQLLLAECDYHLGRTLDVIQHLESAIRMGFTHPLVHFARGYNLHTAAIQKYTEAGPRKGEIVVRDPEGFNRACRDAIDAFREGLGNGQFDAQIHWWIGMIWEMTGDRFSACDAYQRAMDIDPEHFAAQGAEKLRALGEERPSIRSPEEEERLAKLNPITEEELQKARAVLEEWDTFPSFFGDAEE